MDRNEYVIDCAPSTSDNSEDCLKNLRKRRRNFKHEDARFKCDKCSYASDVKSNVDRHKKNIHVQQICKKCCDETFLTKADWYQHVENFHPRSRSRFWISKEVYKIVGSKQLKSPVPEDDQRKIIQVFSKEEAHELNAPKEKDFHDPTNNNNNNDDKFILPLKKRICRDLGIIFNK